MRELSSCHQTDGEAKVQSSGEPGNNSSAHFPPLLTESLWSQAPCNPALRPHLRQDPSVAPRMTAIQIWPSVSTSRPRHPNLPWVRKSRPGSGGSGWWLAWLRGPCQRLPRAARSGPFLPLHPLLQLRGGETSRCGIPEGENGA